MSNSQRKLSYLKERVKEENVKILLMTETHLNPNIMDEEIQIPKFSVFRTDRIKRKCGGVLILVENSLSVLSSNIKHFSNSVCELLIINISNN